MHSWKWAVLNLTLFAVLGACAPLTNYHAEGLRLMEAGRTNEAWEAFEKGYEKDPDSPFSLNNMGYVLEMRDGNLIAAAEFYRRAIKVCEARRGDPGMDRLEKLAYENLNRVVQKIQASPMRYVSARGPGTLFRTG